MATTAVARHGHARRQDANPWVIPVVLAAWVTVLLCGYLVSGLA
jgi:hypothetical protein